MVNVVLALVIFSVGSAIGIPSYFTWSRRWPGMIAGFDAARCSDFDVLTRRVGAAGVALGIVYLFAGALVWLVPETLVAVSVAIAICSVTDLGVTMSACSRFTRR